MYPETNLISLFRNFIDIHVSEMLLWAQGKLEVIDSFVLLIRVLLTYKEPRAHRLKVTASLCSWE